MRKQSVFVLSCAAAAVVGGGAFLRASADAPIANGHVHTANTGAFHALMHCYGGTPPGQPTNTGDAQPFVSGGRATRQVCYRENPAMGSNNTMQVLGGALCTLDDTSSSQGQQFWASPATEWTSEKAYITRTVCTDSSAHPKKYASEAMCKVLDGF